MARILRGLTSHVLACGCLVGVYETYDGRIVTVLDARGDACHDAAHAPGIQGPPGASPSDPPGVEDAPRA
jgi:hypothetical protein